MIKAAVILLVGFVMIAGMISAFYFYVGDHHAGTDNTTDNKSGMPEPGEKDRIRDIGLGFISDDETYRFDGINNTLSVYYNRTLEGNAHEVIAEFTCAHGGYGDRTGKLVTEALTPHKVVLTIVDGNILTAISDNAWDMVNEKPVA